MQRVAINGFGRIGRNVLRAWFENPKPFHFEIVAINDVADVETLVHLFKYDTTHGRFDGAVNIEEENNKIYLCIDVRQTKLRDQILRQTKPELLPWQDLNVDIVLECTGLFRSREAATQHITAGAKRVIIGAAPFDTVDAAIVYGVNHQEVKASDQIISSVSCTTQALVPLVKIIDDAFGIDTALMTEIHAVTADQTVLDQVHRDLRRARASGHNIIPTTSSSIAAVNRVMPHMAGKVNGYSIRVPTMDVAAIDVTFTFDKATDVTAINQLLKHASEQDLLGIMDYSDEPLVSSDFIHDAHSLVIDSLQTMSVGRQFKVFAWYDNELGYANRLLDLCELFNSEWFVI